MDNSIDLTDKAAARIRHLAEKQGNAALFLRLQVDSGGCSGMQYKFSLDEKMQADADLNFERNGARLVVDKVSLDFLKGSQVDFVSDLSGEMFVVKNPNAESGCGCGVSFAVKM
jgi:iron-sulfur cluster insertion protein